jgi:hypothetical protein
MHPVFTYAVKTPVGLLLIDPVRPRRAEQGSRMKIDDPSV